MTTEEKKMILDLSMGSISIDYFFLNYPMDLGMEKDYILSVLNQAYQERNSDDVEYALLLGFTISFFTEDFVDILCKLIREGWHYKHEDIVLILQELKSPESIDAIYDTALRKFDYLSYDDSYALARRCIHALGDINTEYSIEKLKLLASSEILIIREKAEKQLHYYKR